MCVNMCECVLCVCVCISEYLMTCVCESLWVSVCLLIRAFGVEYYITRFCMSVFGVTVCLCCVFFSFCMCVFVCILYYMKG